MEAPWMLRHGPGGDGLWLKPGPDLQERRVCTSAEAGRILARSRRQVYRGIKEGTLPSYGKVLGEWLLDLAGVESIRKRPAMPQRLPKRFQAYFPEHDIRALNPGRDRHLVISRLLEHGTVSDIRWVRRRFTPDELAAFLAEDGARLLSPRPLRFWSLFLGVPMPARPSWRGPDWIPGGPL